MEEQTERGRDGERQREKEGERKGGTDKNAKQEDGRGEKRLRTDGRE